MTTPYNVQRGMIRAKSRVPCLRLRGFAPRASSDFSYCYLSRLREELIARNLPIITDYMTPMPARLLKTTLLDFIPYSESQVPTSNKLSVGHHLVYFPSQTRLSSLYPDGTDPLHSPGPPFTRRMWAGGSMRFLKPLRSDSSAFHVSEKIMDVHFRGKDDEQKVFVTIERTIRRGNKSDDLTVDSEPHVLETRDLVFMHEKPQPAPTQSEQSSAKFLKPANIPDHFITLTPTPALLFRFSALTFNAHTIHLDKRYCQEVEGHRNLLVHGPLTLVLMLEVLKLFLAKEKMEDPEGRQVESIKNVDYRNLSPMYAEEEMKICVRRKTLETHTGSFDIWIEGKEGGYAVKGLAETSVQRPLENHPKWL